MDRMNRAIRLLVPALVMAGAVPQHAAADGPGIIGDYYRDHTIQFFDGRAKSRENVRDDLTIRDAGDGRIAFTLDIVANNGHSCEMSGVALPTGSHFEYREQVNLTPGSEPGERPAECVLRFKLNNREIVLEDAEHHCRLFYCGWRGKLDGLRFSRARRE